VSGVSGDAFLRTWKLNLDSTVPLSLTSTSLVCSTASIRNPRSSRIFSSEVSTRTWRTLTSATYVVRRSIGWHSPWLTFFPTLQDHSIVPEKDEDWPTLQEILEFRDRVRQRVLGLYDDIEKGERKYTRRVGRILWMTYEHEAFHAEVSQ